MSHSREFEILSVVADIGLATANIVAFNHGYSAEHSSLARDIVLALWAYLSPQVLYKFAINLTKISICFLILQIFCLLGAPSNVLSRAIRMVMFWVVGFEFGKMAILLGFSFFTLYFSLTRTFPFLFFLSLLFHFLLFPFSFSPFSPFFFPSSLLFPVFCILALAFWEFEEFRVLFDFLPLFLGESLLPRFG